jgi:ribosomal protein L40E
MIASAAVSFGGGIGSIIVFCAIFCIYMIPTLLAYNRKVTNVGSVFVINFFLGWTFIGWIVALAMAAKSSLPVVGPNQVMVVTGSNVQLKDQEAATVSGVMSSVNLETSQTPTGEVCNRCNQELPTGAKFCIKCGEPASAIEQTLSASDVKGNNSTKWCDNCNKELDANVNSAPSVVPRRLR